MGEKKPTLTKQIGFTLGPDDKREQLERVQNLVQIANDVPVAVTVLFTRNVAFITVKAPIQVNTQQTKAILVKAIEQLTRMEVEDELKQDMPKLPEIGSEEGEPDPAEETE